MDALWVLARILSNDSCDSAYIVDLGVMPMLVRLLNPDTNVRVRRQAVWSLGSLIYSSVERRDLAIESGVLPSLFLILESEPHDIGTVEFVAWIFFGIYKDHPRPDNDVAEAILPRLFLFFRLNEITLDMLTCVCWILSVITADQEYLIQYMIEQRVISHIQSVFIEYSDNLDLIRPAIRTLGAIAGGTQEQTNAIVTSGVMAHFLPFLSCEEELLVKDLCWTISNITAGSESQIQAIIDNGLIPKLVELCFSESNLIRKEALWAMVNMTGIANVESVVSELCQQDRMEQNPMLLNTILRSLNCVRNLNPVKNDPIFRQSVGYLIHQKLLGGQIPSID